ncbi:uncharacterized protein ELE39_003449 [Cryptosporidium sp. chipmunk genotype I]|uniref:uncharacterized protein n=1 Tax=Cryptosporidium sp. chipmunk genotype I TaxID=1280935 RepID=UPI00351A730F|nr:hypothetical protein ELE39_003449 [Cryptosporidium sp. chipmunk genotype I]
MKLIYLFPYISLVLVLFCDFTEKRSTLSKISLIRTKIFSNEGSLSDERIIQNSSNKLRNEPVLYEVNELIDISDLSEEDEENDELIFIDDIERSNLGESVSDDEGEISIEDKMKNIEGDSQKDDELVVDKESEALGFNAELYFNSQKCFLMLGFEVEFLESPVLNNSGIIKYIKEAEISTEGETVKSDKDSDYEKYKLIELETRNKKQDEIISLMKQIRESCWNITSESTQQEFKDEVLEIIAIIETKISQINKKLENYIKITDKKSSEFDYENYESNMEKKSKLFGRKSSYELALSSFKRIEEYWTHLENLPCSV